MKEQDTLTFSLPAGRFRISQAIRFQRQSSSLSTVEYKAISDREAMEYNWGVNCNNEYMPFNADSAIIRFDIANQEGNSGILVDSVVVKSTDNTFMTYSITLPTTIESHIFLNEDRTFNYDVEAYYKKQYCGKCSYTFIVHKSEILFEDVRQKNINSILNGFRE